MVSNSTSESQRDICTPITIHHSLEVNQPKCSLADEWINKTWCVHPTEHYSALKRKETLAHARTWMNFGDIILTEISQ